MLDPLREAGGVERVSGAAQRQNRRDGERRRRGQAGALGRSEVIVTVTGPTFSSAIAAATSGGGGCAEGSRVTATVTPWATANGSARPPL